MKKHRIMKEELEQIYNFPTKNFPKYTTQIINLANQNAQGTRAPVVGQMTELFPEYRKTQGKHSLEQWRKWYLERHPDGVDKATKKIEGHIENLKKAIDLIDHDMISQWVIDLVINKTYMGLYYQQVILSHLAKENNKSWRLATVEEESKGIDGYVGECAYSVKPTTYKKTMKRLPETIDATMIYYSVSKTGNLTITVED